MKLNRRTFLGTGAAATGLIGLNGLPLRAQDRTLNVTAYGGVWERAIRDCFVAPFEAKTGATATVSLGGPAQWLRSRPTRKTRRSMC